MQASLVTKEELLPELVGYAVASCLALQDAPDLQRQGYGWASVIAQRTEGGVDTLIGVYERVKTETARNEMVVMRDDVEPGQEITLPIMHCYEVAHRPSVQAAVREAARLHETSPPE